MAKRRDKAASPAKKAEDGTFFLLHEAPWGLDAANAPSPTEAGAAPSEPASAGPAAPAQADLPAGEARDPAAAFAVAEAQPDDGRPLAPTAISGAPPRAVEIPKDFIPCAESDHALYQIDTEHFAGPLDLLLFLIRRHTIDVFDIPIGFICQQYLDCLQIMEDLSLDVASEFMYMASELLHIKSRMLLPKPEDAEEEDEGDPRAELVQRLLEYQRYQAAADQLGDLQRLGRDVFARAPEPLPAAGPPQLREVNIFALVHAFNAVLKRQKPEVRHRVVVEQISVRKRMHVLIDAFGATGSARFFDLLGSARARLDVIVTFLAVLELTRLKLLRICEAEDGELILEARFEGAQEALQRLEGVEEQFAG